ncbi:MAG: hypothetical protein ACYCX4_11260 [Bacillota bacterium]
MATSINLEEKELQVLIKATGTCMEKCRSGGPIKGCEDCQTLERIMDKITKARSNT